MLAATRRASQEITEYRVQLQVSFVLAEWRLRLLGLPR
jgi:hypothetical protein